MFKTGSKGMKGSSKHITLAACMAGAVLFLVSAGAGAEKIAKCRVMTIHASNKEGKTDEKLKKLPILKKAPFNAYKAFKLISDKTHMMALKKPVALSLPMQSELSGKLAFEGFNEALKELNFKLYVLKSKSKEPEEINFAVHGKAPFLYVRPFKNGLLLLSITCALAEKEKEDGG
jgi:hypothetical protein